MFGIDFSQWMGILRTLLASLGGSSIVTTYFTNDAWMAFVGAVVVVVTAIWSIMSKKKVGETPAA